MSPRDRHVQRAKYERREKRRLARHARYDHSPGDAFLMSYAAYRALRSLPFRLLRLEPMPGSEPFMISARVGYGITIIRPRSIMYADVI